MKEVENNFNEILKAVTPNTYGINETRDLLVFLAKFGNAIDRSLEDGEVGWLDGRFLLDPLMVAKPAFEGANLIPNELGDLSSSEAMDLTATVAAELDLDNENAEVLTEKGVALALALVAYVNELRAAKSGQEEI